MEWGEIVLKIVGEGGVWALALWLGKGWFEAKVLEPIKELKKSNVDMKLAHDNALAELKMTRQDITKEWSMLKNEIRQKLVESANLFSRATEYAQGAQSDAKKAIDQLNLSANQTDQKLKNLALNLGSNLKTEIKKINDELIIIKGKK